MTMPMISEILEHADKLKGKQAKIEYLRSQVHNKVLLMILKATYDAAIKFALPEGAPPYEECEFVDQHGRLYQEARKIHLFLTPECGGNPNLHQIKRETIFIQLLEGIDPKEAKVLVGMKEKDLPYKNITGELIDEAFPNLLTAIHVPEKKTKKKEVKKKTEKKHTATKQKPNKKKTGTSATKKTTKKVAKKKSSDS
jgi:hypothetical protein